MTNQSEQATQRRLTKAIAATVGFCIMLVAAYTLIGPWGVIAVIGWRLAR